jgi:hypothetical protein
MSIRAQKGSALHQVHLTEFQPGKAILFPQRPVCHQLAEDMQHDRLFQANGGGESGRNHQRAFGYQRRLHDGPASGKERQC